MTSRASAAEITIPGRFPPAADVAGKRVVLSGAGRGLGRVLAVAFARQGAHVGLASRSAKDLDELVATLPGEHIALPGDVREPEFHEELMERMITTFGGVDVVVANAGISPTVRGIERTELDQWHDVIATNLSGAFLAARAAARAMGPGGRFIVTSSVLGQRPMSGLAAYSASKAGVDALVRSLAVELGERAITVNGVALGWFDSPLAREFRAREDVDRKIVEHTALRRWGTAADLPGIFLFLASEASQFITGAVIPVDGGYLLR